MPLIAGLVFVGLLFLAVFPTRTYLAQRRDRAAAEAQLQLLSRQNRSLEQRARLLHTDAEIERLAREQYNLVRPGEEAYAILPAPAPPKPAASRHPAVRHHPSLLSRAWARITGIF